MPLGVRVNNLVYPVHAAKVGGIVYQLIMTLVGLVLTMLGGLVVVKFWMDRHRISVPPRI